MPLLGPLFPRSLDRACVETISITRKSYDGRTPEGYRYWTVIVAINNKREVERRLTDPFLETQYSGFNGLVLDAEVQSRTASEYVENVANMYAEQCAKTYFDDLIKPLGLTDGSYHGSRDLQVYIHEEHHTTDDEDRAASSEPSIYALFWEVLENTHFWKLSEHEQPTRVRVCRTWICHAGTPGPEAQPARQLSALPNQRTEYRILLVIARSFRRDRTMRFRDYRPSLVLGPLLKIALWSRQSNRLPRVRLHVVRPGTMEELQNELERTRKLPYDIVHFDMHGRIAMSESETDPFSRSATPFLRFAKPFNARLRKFRSENPIAELMGKDDSLCDIKVGQVASLLQQHGVSRIALSACLSSYAQRNMLANMCHLFLRRGASHVSAMSFQVLENTAQIYYAAFYEALLTNGHTFLSAAALGREALRAEPSQSSNAFVPTNYHLATRINTNEFWPEHQVKVVWPSLLAAYCLRLGAASIAVHALSSASYCDYFSWLRSLKQRLVCLFIASLVFYGSVLWVERLKCPLKINTPDIPSVFGPRENLKNLSSEFEIEHLVLEDRLEFEANRRAIYLWSDDGETNLETMIRSLARMWASTGFVDRIDVVPAICFTSWLSNFQWWLRLRMTSFKAHEDIVGSSGSRRLIVITDFDKLYELYKRRNVSSTARSISGDALGGLEVALGRMTRFISQYGIAQAELDMDNATSLEIDGKADRVNLLKNHNETVERTDNTAIPQSAKVDDDTPESANTPEANVSGGKTYLLVTGSLTGQKWSSLPWYKFRDEVTEAIGRAVPHCHDVLASP